LLTLRRKPAITRDKANKVAETATSPRSRR
jgi:hypothetical protein